MKKIILFMLMILLLTGCSKNYYQRSNDIADSSVGIKPTMQTETNKKNSSNENPHKTTEDQQSDYKKYADFLGRKESVSKCLKEDIDLDGKKEIILSFGSDGNMSVFIIREIGSVLQNIGKIDGQAYGVSGFELVKMQGKKQKYIKTDITNGWNLKGFALYEVAKNDLKEIIYIASASGEGNDYMVDSNGDGFYDGYNQHRYSYDVLYFDVSRCYKWNGVSFNALTTNVQFEDNPDNPKDTVLLYLKLNVLNTFDSCEDIANKLKEIDVSNKHVQFGDSGIWGNNLSFESEDLKIDAKEKENAASVAVSLKEEKLLFTLCKNQNQWQITEISGNIVY